MDVHAYVSGSFGPDPSIRYAFTRATVSANIAVPESSPAVLATVLLRVDQISFNEQRTLEPVDGTTHVGFGALSLEVRGQFAECCNSGGTNIDLRRSRAPQTVAVGSILETSFAIERGAAATDTSLTVSTGLVGVVDPGLWPAPGSATYSISARVTMLSIETRALDAPGAHVIEAHAPYQRSGGSIECNQGLIVSKCISEYDANPGAGVATATSAVESLAGDGGPAEGESRTSALVTEQLSIPESVDSIAIEADVSVSDISETVPPVSGYAGWGIVVMVRPAGSCCTTWVGQGVISGDQRRFSAVVHNSNGEPVPAGTLDVTLTVSTWAWIYEAGLGPVRSTATATLDLIRARY
ncbi:MAG: hypothetical protein ABR548_11510 [Actinomycetota bacterium]|nr:hypothetical protein [Actinomycetota bacterium]